MGNLRLGKVIGIPIELNLSWFVIFGLLFWSLSGFLFPTLIPRLSSLSYATMGGIATLLFFASLVFHELSHSFVGQHYGIKVDRIVLFLFGGVSETSQEMPNAKAEFWVAVAGPLSSIFLCFFFFLFSLVLLPFSGPAALVSQWLGLINLVLALFNLLPGFPLDGGRVLRSLIWRFSGNQRFATRIASRTGQVLAGGLMIWGVIRLFTGNFLGGMWIFFLGWLLLSAAANEYSELVLRQALGRVKVSELMSREVKVVSPDLSLEEAVHEYFLRYPFGGYPVADPRFEGNILGIVTLSQIREVPREEWGLRRVSQVMLPLVKEDALSEEDDVATALLKFRTTGLGRLPVLVDHQLIGILSQSDVIRWLNAHPELSRED